MKKGVIKLALINCPECNKEISNYAKSCPHCGFPLSTDYKNISEFKYDVILTGFYGSKIDIIKCVRNTLKLDIPEAMDLTNNIPSFLKRNISLDEANEIKEAIETSGASIVIEKYNDGQDDKSILKKHTSNLITCPRCGSTAITTGQRGFNIVTGFLGSNKTVNRCGKCGYSWQPK